jgi:hypothetical protein
LYSQYFYYPLQITAPVFQSITKTPFPIILTRDAKPYGTVLSYRKCFLLDKNNPASVPWYSLVHGKCRNTIIVSYVKQMSSSYLGNLPKDAKNNV